MLRKLYNLLSSPRLAVLLFFAIALTSILGTVIQQGMPEEIYVMKYNDTVFFILDFFDIFDMYHSWWYTLLLAMFALNLTTCTLRQVPSIRKMMSSSGAHYDDSVFKTSPIKVSWKSRDGMEEIERMARGLLGSLAAPPVHARKGDASYFFAQKGRSARLGMPFIHVSILSILAGGLIGTVWGFGGQMNIEEGQGEDTVVLYNQKGTRKLDYTVYCRDFNLELYESGMPKEYKTDLAIVENGQEVFSDAIRVNHPMYYKGMKFCQASYGLAGMEDFTIMARQVKTGKVAELKLNLMEKAPLPDCKDFLGVAKYTPDYEGRGPSVMAVLIGPDKHHDIFWISSDDWQHKGGFDFLLSGFEKVYYSGIQVSKDPGTLLVWGGFILILLGFMLSLFLVHTRVWLRILPVSEGHEIVVAASTSKNRQAFKQRLYRLTDQYRQGGIR